MKELFLKYLETTNLIDKEKIRAIILTTFILELNDNSNSKSVIGGTPLIPESIFPYYNGNKLSFLTNICLREMSYTNPILPDSGSLLLYIYIGNLGYRFPNRKNEFKVIYLKDEKIIISNRDFKFFNIKFHEHISIPSYQESILDGNQITAEELNIIDNFPLKPHIKKGYDIDHQVFGHPTALQGTVRFWWSVIYLGYLIEDVDSFTFEQLNEIKKEEDNFILLLQLNFGDPRIRIDNFGDSIAYFGIHKNDLSNLNFENTILVMQNT